MTELGKEEERAEQEVKKPKVELGKEYSLTYERSHLEDEERRIVGSFAGFDNKAPNYSARMERQAWVDRGNGDVVIGSVDRDKGTVVVEERIPADRILLASYAKPAGGGEVLPPGDPDFSIDAGPKHQRRRVWLKPPAGTYKVCTGGTGLGYIPELGVSERVTYHFAEVVVPEPKIAPVTTE